MPVGAVNYGDTQHVCACWWRKLRTRAASTLHDTACRLVGDANYGHLPVGDANYGTGDTSSRALHAPKARCPVILVTNEPASMSSRSQIADTYACQGTAKQERIAMVRRTTGIEIARLSALALQATYPQAPW